MENLKEYHCANCRKVLFFGEITEGKVSKDCPKCGERNLITVVKVATTKIELIKKPFTHSVLAPIGRVVKNMQLANEARQKIGVKY